MYKANHKIFFVFLFLITCVYGRPRKAKIKEHREHSHGHGDATDERIHVRHSGLENFGTADGKDPENVLHNMDFVRNVE